MSKRAPVPRLYTGRAGAKSAAKRRQQWDLERERELEQRDPDWDADCERPITESGRDGIALT